jgi:hypothetical protein
MNEVDDGPTNDRVSVSCANEVDINWDYIDLKDGALRLGHLSGVF